MLNVLREYSRKLVISYFVVVSMLIILAQTLYRDYFKSVIDLALSEEYSYLLVSLFSVLSTMYLSIKLVGFSYGVRVSKILASLTILTMSIVLYVVSLRNPEYMIQLQGASFAMVFMSLVLFIYEPSTPGDVVPMLTPLLLIPLPTSIVDSLTPVLSRLIGKVVSILTGAIYVESTFVVLKVETPLGIYSFSIEAACTGIVTLSSVFSVFPVLAYMITASKSSTTRKILVALMSLLSGLLIGLLGNLIRVLLVVLVARHVNPQLALSVFHYSPSVLYSIFSTILSYIIAVKYTGLDRALPKPLLSDKSIPHVSLEVFSGTLIILVLLMSSIYSTLVLTLPARSVSSSHVIHVDSIESAIHNPTILLGASAFHVVHNVRDDYLTRVIGALNVLRVRVLVDGEFYTGFIEVVDTPARLHTWQLCLTLQGYKIISSWSTEVDSKQVSYILMEKEGENYILAYTIFPVVLRATGLESVMYLRVSLLKSYINPERDVERVTKAVLELTPPEVFNVGEFDVGVYIILSYALMGILLAYLCLMLLVSVTSRPGTS